MKLTLKIEILNNICKKHVCKILLLVFIFAQFSCSEKLEKLQHSENSFELTTEDDLKSEVVLQTISDFYKKGEEGRFFGVDSIPIYYKIFKQPGNTSKAILIASGRTEAAIKYKELIFDLYKQGYSIFIHDHRGQGFSGRMTSEYELGFVNNFQDYITDMKSFYTMKVAPNNYENCYLIAHSMGGAIGLSYLEQFQHDFTAAAFSSPMFGLSFMKCSVGETFNQNKETYAPTQGPYNESKESFANNTLTNSEVRFNIFRNAFDENASARLGGISLQWLNESCKQFDYMKDNLQELKTPSVLFSGEEESIVAPKSHIDFVEKAELLQVPLKGYFVENAKHELLIEKDEVRISVISTILQFFDSHSN